MINQSKIESNKIVQSQFMNCLNKIVNQAFEKVFKGY